MGYAVFASMGREVRIGQLALHICAVSLKKTARKGLVIGLERDGGLCTGYVGIAGGEGVGGIGRGENSCAQMAMALKLLSLNEDGVWGRHGFKDIKNLVNDIGMFVWAGMPFYFIVEYD